MIKRIKTEVYFTDDAGTCWTVVDARSEDGRLIGQYPGVANAHHRYFVRYRPASGSIPRAALEVRRYTFTAGESRWFNDADWQRQLSAADVRLHRSQNSL